MIEIPYKTVEKRLYFSKNGEKPEDYVEYDLEIKSELTQENYYIPLGRDLHTKDNYYCFEPDFYIISKLPDGEYTYKLVNPYSGVIDRGILRIGFIQPTENKRQYDNNNDKIITYNG